MSRARRLLEIAKANEAIASGGNQWWLADAPAKPEAAPPTAEPAQPLEAAPVVPAHSPLDAIKPPVNQPASHTPALEPVVAARFAAAPAAQAVAVLEQAEPAKVAFYNPAPAAQPVSVIENRAHQAADPVNPPSMHGDFPSRLAGLREKFILFGRRARVAS